MNRIAFVLLAFTAPSASAAELEVHVRNAKGVAVRDAVVTLHLVGRPTPPAVRQGGYAVVQKNIQFNPYVLIVPVGAESAFPNQDDVRHHVYSFSRAKRFELKLYQKQQNRTVLFDKPGAVPLGCNIHDRMTAFIKVVDTAYALKTSASGIASFRHVPAGEVVARVWHPYLRAPGNETVVRLSLTQSSARKENVTVNLRSPPVRAESSY